jgi:ABC-2 type transport system ATP-binding protein
MEFIEINDINKSFGSTRAIQDISLTIPENCLFGLIGPDGAGKTTLFRLITTLLLPDQGTIAVFGYDAYKNYRQIRLFTGYMPGRFSLYPDLSVTENLSFYATIFGTTVKEHYSLIQPIYSLLEPYGDRLARNLSGGMKQKLALCCALIHNPRLLVLDEPTTGVDAVSRKEFWETLQLLKESGMTILVSTPYMDEAARCDRIAMMQEGRIMVNDRPQSILKDFSTPLFEVRGPDRLGILRQLRSLPEVRRAYLFGHSIHIALTSQAYDAGLIISRLTEFGITGLEIQSVTPDFEDCFIEGVELNQKDKVA